MAKKNTNLSIKGSTYEQITYEEAKKAGYVGSEHVHTQPDGNVAYHIQSGTYWTLED